MRRLLMVAVAVLSLGLVSCQTMTPEEQAAAEKAKAAFTTATDVLNQAQALMASHIAEYNAIKALVDAGQSIPAAAFARFQELQKLISSDVVIVKDAVEKFNAAKKANEDAAAAGVAWYNRIDWWTVGKVGGGIALGLIGLYLPVVRPLTTAVQANIQGVATYAKENPDQAQAIKDAVLAASRCLKVEAKVDALVQKFDPPEVPPGPTV